MKTSDILATLKSRLTAASIPVTHPAWWDEDTSSYPRVGLMALGEDAEVHEAAVGVWRTLSVAVLVAVQASPGQDETALLDEVDKVRAALLPPMSADGTWWIVIDGCSVQLEIPRTEIEAMEHESNVAVAQLELTAQRMERR